MDLKTKNQNIKKTSGMSTQHTTNRIEEDELLFKSKVKELVDFYWATGIEGGEIHETTTRLLNCYVLSDFIESDNRESRDRIVSFIMDINRIITMLEDIKNIDTRILQAKNPQS